MQTPRSWNGSILYTTQPNAPTLRVFGSGCAGTNGVPTLDQTPGSWPKLGATQSLDMTQLPFAPGVVWLMLGVSDSVWAGGALPFDLSAV